MGIRAQGASSGPNNQNYISAEFRDTYGRTGKDGGEPVPPPRGITASGGNTTTSPYVDADGKTYKSHIFTASGSLVVSDGGSPDMNDIQYLVVGGGSGTGTRWHTGGGGAGGL